MASEIQADLVVGSSLKTALDLNWDNPEERNLAIPMVLGVLSQVENHLELDPQTKCHQVVSSSLEAARQIEAQDVEVDQHGIAKLKQGVAKNRRISIEDEEMRHGRKNRSKRFDGYKRHILKDERYRTGASGWGYQC